LSLEWDVTQPLTGDMVTVGVVNFVLIEYG